MQTVYAKKRPIKAKTLLITSLCTIYLIGFIPQHLGIISITQTNFIVIALTLSLFIANTGYALGGMRNYRTILIALLVFTASVTITATTKGTGILSFIVYIYYISTIACSILISQFSCKAIQKKPDWLNKAILLFIAIQIFTAIIQTIFHNQISAASQITIIREDIVSGTFFLKSDASLLFVMNVVTIYLFTSKQKIKTRYLSLISTIILSHLLGSKFLLIATYINAFTLSSIDLLPKTKRSRVTNYYMLLLGIFLTTSALIFFSAELKEIRDAALLDIYHSRFASYGAHRLAGLSEIAYSELSFFGEGLLTYHNPMSDEWLYYSGHSTLYSTYIDTGLLGTLSLFSIFFACIYKMQIKIPHKIIFAFTFIGFCLFNNILSDFAALIIFFLFYHLTAHSKQN